MSTIIGDIKERWGLDDPSKVVCSTCGYLADRAAVEHDDCPGTADLSDALLSAVDDIAMLLAENKRMRHALTHGWTLRQYNWVEDVEGRPALKSEAE